MHRGFESHSIQRPRAFWEAVSCRFTDRFSRSGGRQSERITVRRPSDGRAAISVSQLVGRMVYDVPATCIRPLRVCTASMLSTLLQTSSIGIPVHPGSSCKDPGRLHRASTLRSVERSTCRSLRSGARAGTVISARNGRTSTSPFTAGDSSSQIRHLPRLRQTLGDCHVQPLNCRCAMVAPVQYGASQK